jgi:hypothetical protein
MDDNLAWTTAVGQAFVYQPQDVMDSIQRLRAEAQALGNLQTTPQENVITDDGIIELLPADPQVIYLPVFECVMVFFQSPYGVPFISFGLGWPLGLWLNYDFDWRHHHLIVWGNGQARPANWWSLRPSQRLAAAANQATVWLPRPHPVSVASGMDRGYYSRPGQSTVTVIGAQSRPGGRSQPPTTYARQPEPAGQSTVTVTGGQSRPAARPEAVVVQHPVEAPRSQPANGAFIGVESTHETQQFSTRGQESRQAPAFQPAAPAFHSEPVHSAPPPLSPPPAASGRR